MAVLTGNHNLCFGQIKKITDFHFLDVNFFSVYLNSDVFVMFIKFVVGHINGIFDVVETETRKFHY